jgi:hypothetical protein
MYTLHTHLFTLPEPVGYHQLLRGHLAAAGGCQVVSDEAGIFSDFVGILTVGNLSAGVKTWRLIIAFARLPHEE